MGWPASAHPSAGFTFVPDPSQPSLPAGSSLAAVADVTGGGAPDLIIENAQTGTLGVMVGDGAGGFGLPSAIALGARPVGAQVADFNNDGHPDLLVALETKVTPRELNPLPEAVEILTGEGNGAFRIGSQVRLPEPSWPRVGDFTGDGNQDVVGVPSSCLAGGNGSKLYMLLGDGHGDLTPGPTTTDEHAGCSSEVGDFNKDGRDDLASYAIPPNARETGDIVVFPGESDGTFGTPISTAAPPGGWVLAHGTADFDGNGTLDLIMALFSEPSTLDVLEGNGAGTFTASGPFADGANLGVSTAPGDFNGDGHVDIAAVSSQITILENNGAGAFSPGVVAPVPGIFPDPLVADVNRDRRTDIILRGISGVFIFENEPVTAPVPVAVQPPPAPALTGVRQSARAWREGSRLARIARRRPPVGTTFYFTLNEQAKMSFLFTQHTGGRRVNGRCVAPRTGNRRKRHCKLALRRGRMTFLGHAGANKVSFQGRISRSTKLKPGHYTLVITATNSTGAHSAPAALSFTVVR
jgi:FG-GAP-like repeat